MTVTKLLDPKPRRVILTTVEGDTFSAKRRESQLKKTIWREVQTCRFVNTQDSTRAWSILDIDPIKPQYIQDELDRICTTLPSRTTRTPKSNRNLLLSLFDFMGCCRFLLSPALTVNGLTISLLELQTLHLFESPGAYIQCNSYNLLIAAEI